MVAPVSTVMLGLFLGAASFMWLSVPSECGVFGPPPPSSGAFRLPSCQPIKHLVSLEKSGCPQCHLVETTICSGHCLTKDPVAKVLYHKLFQHACVYGDMYYKTFHIPDCPPGVNPTVVYPVALSCHCGRCNMNTSDCTSQSLRPDFCLNDIPQYS